MRGVFGPRHHADGADPARARMLRAGALGQSVGGRLRRNIGLMYFGVGGGAQITAWRSGSATAPPAGCQTGSSAPEHSADRRGGGRSSPCCAPIRTAFCASRRRRCFPRPGRRDFWMARIQSRDVSETGCAGRASPRGFRRLRMPGMAASTSSRLMPLRSSGE